MLRHGLHHLAAAVRAPAPHLSSLALAADDQVQVSTATILIVIIIIIAVPPPLAALVPAALLTTTVLAGPPALLAALTLYLRPVPTSTGALPTLACVGAILPCS
jgi:hypothetical protein